MKLAILLLAFVWLALLGVSIAYDYDPEAEAKSEYENLITHDSEHEYGSLKKGKKYSAKKGYKKKDRSSIFDEEYGKKGKDGFSIHKIDDLEKGGKKSKYFDDGFYKDYDYHSGASAYGGNHKSGAGKKARNYSKGYREKYHKDEHKKHDSWFSKGNKKGMYDKYGEENSKYENDHYKKHSGSNKHAAKTSGNYGKQGSKAKGHKESEKKGYNKKDGKKSHHANNKKWSKGSKSKSSSGKRWDGKNKADAYKYIPIK